MIDYDEEWLWPLLFQREGSVAFRASLYAIPSAFLGIIIVYLEEIQPGLREELGFPDLSGSHIWNAATGVCMIMLAFRTRTALSRFWEGTGLLHQMRGEWFDTVSNCVTFSIAAKPTQPVNVMKFRHSLVRLMSLCHGSALEEIADNQIAVDVVDIAGLDFGTLAHLQECDQVHGFNKVEVMLHLVQSLITKAHDDSILKIPPPILSRVYQTISRGFVNLLNAKKITDTKFPFPYAQLIAGLMFLDTVLTPIMIGQAVRSKILAALLTFVPIFGMYSLNFIAAELEDPFGIDANDLPLGKFQKEMNSCLLMLLHPNTDMIAGTSSRVITDFNELLEAFERPAEDPNSVKRRLSAYDMTRIARLHAADDRRSVGAFGEETDALPAPDQAGASPPRPETPEPPPPIDALPPPEAPAPLTPRLEPDSEEVRRLKEEEAIRLEAAQREVEKRMNEFYLALQRWTLMIESQVKQIHDILDVLRLLSETAGKEGGWEQAILPV